MILKRLSVIFLAFSLTVAQFSFADEIQLSKAEVAAHVHRANSMVAGLGKENELRLSKSQKDELQTGHAKFVQYYKSVRVFGGEMISHTDRSGNLIKETDALYRNINISVVPTITESNAKTIVDRDIKPRGNYKVPQKFELVIYPVLTLLHVRAGEDATAYEYTPAKYVLAYIVSSKIEVPGQTEHHKHVIDAKSGAVIKHWDDLHTAAATGTGHTQYSGAVLINSYLETTGSFAGWFVLIDLTRGGVTPNTVPGNYVLSFNGLLASDGLMFSSTSDWGDGLNYSGSNTYQPNGQTAAVDAAYGMQVTWDMFKYVFNRNGIDNKGKATYSATHYSTGYNNAFWSDACFCMTYGDGDNITFKVLTALDVAAHEMSHGVVANSVSGGLTYSGESGGLNESNSDIMGTMTEFYQKGGGYESHATSIPSSGGNWTIGEQITISNNPLRYMNKPSLDLHSFDAWSSTIGTFDVHYSSGPGNRAFYFLSQGSSNVSGSNLYSSYLPTGMVGVGNDHAARIHYRAMTTYYTSSTTYSAARTAYLNAATDLYGNNSPEVIAVMNAFAAVNVGLPGTNPPAPSAVSSVAAKILPIVMQLILD